MSLLEISGISKRFGGLTAISDVSFSIPEGEIFALIGPNGAGKTTMVNIISGLLTSTSGTLRFAGREIGNSPPWRVSQAGLTRIYQSGRLFERLSVRENVYVGAIGSPRRSLPASMFDFHPGSRTRRELNERAELLLADFGLDELGDEPISSLSYGQRRMVEFARALMPRPKLVLLDEPAAGLNLGEAENLIKSIDRVRSRSIAVLLIEHNMGLVMRLADRIAVLNFGQKICEGTPAEVQSDENVIKAYLGDGSRHAAR